MAWLGTWKKRRKITISNTNIDSALSNFPILVKISASSGTGSADITDIFSELGSDANRKKIAITTDNGETQCYVEIERFDYTNSAAWLWVRVPSASDSVGTELYIYFDSSQPDNTTYIGDTCDTPAQNVWDTNFKLVVHMSQDPDGDVASAIKDSTSNQYHGTPAGSMTSTDLVDGRVGKGIDFDGSNDYIDSNEDSPFRFGSTDFTYESCAKLAAKTVDRDIVAKGYNYELRYDAGEDYWFFSANDGSYRYAKFSQTNVSLDTWQYIVGTSEGTTLKIYVDTIEGATVGTIGTINETDSTLTIGTGAGGRFFSGIIDEVRISNTARSSAWIKATYYSNWDGLVTYGDIEVSDVSLSPFLSTSSIQADIQIEITNNLFSSTSLFYTGEIFKGLLIECPSPFSAQSSLQSATRIEVNQSLFTSNGSLYVQPEIQLFTESLSAAGSISATITDPFSVATLPRVYTFTLAGAPSIEGERSINSLIVFNSKLYGGTSSNGKLYEWNGSDAWVEVAPQPGSTSAINSLVVYNDKIYGGSNNGKLYEWNGSGAWVEVAAKYGFGDTINSLVVFNDKIYGGTSSSGKLHEWNGSDAWVEVATQYSNESIIHSLVVFNSKLYGGTALHGRLLEWNGADAWIPVASQLGDEIRINYLVVFNSKLYGGTSNNGKLYEWNGSDAWVEVASKLNGATSIKSLVVFNNKLYGSTYPYGRLYEWNGVNAWVDVAPKLGSTAAINSLVIFNSKLYGGTSNNGKLYEWNGSDAWVEVAAKLDIPISDIVIPISSFQCRIKNGDPTYLSVVMPGINYASDINLRLNGDLVLRMGYLSNGEIILSEIISIVDFENIIIYEGPTNKTITLDGHRTETFIPKEINLTGSIYRNITAGKLRYRCTPNLYARPGDTANINNDSFTIENITYSVSPELETFEVSE